MKLATIEKQVTETTDVNLSDVRLHFADDATPVEAGGPGALIAEAPGLGVVRIPASDPVVVALVAKLGTAVAAAPGAKKAVK